MTFSRRLLTLLVPLLLLAGGARAAGCDAPAPTVRPAASDTATPTAKAFAGTWQGQWAVAVKDHAVPICARLYVLVLGPTNATVEQCTGSNKDARRRAECKQFAAQIDGNEMSFSDLQGTIYKLTMADVGGIKAEATSAEHRSVTVFVKPE
ncbi:MAG TPA: hypothetical protein VID77_11045 [Stellaceae bacterium]|jgi:hypothetical protein